MGFSQVAPVTGRRCIPANEELTANPSMKAGLGPDPWIPELPWPFESKLIFLPLIHFHVWFQSGVRTSLQKWLVIQHRPDLQMVKRSTFYAPKWSFGPWILCHFLPQDFSGCFGWVTPWIFIWIFQNYRKNSKPPIPEKNLEPTNLSQKKIHLIIYVRNFQFWRGLFFPWVFFGGSISTSNGNQVEEIRPWSKALSVFASWADPTEERAFPTWGPGEKPPKINMVHLRIHLIEEGSIIWTKPSFSGSMLIFRGCNNYSTGVSMYVMYIHDRDSFLLIHHFSYKILYIYCMWIYTQPLCMLEFIYTDHLHIILTVWV